MQQPDTAEYMRLLTAFIDFQLPRFREEGKPALTVAVGCTGIAVLALAYPMFLHLTKRRRAQLAPQIEALSRELLGQSPACGRETER